MDSFLVYFQIGLHHVLDSNAYDHVLFLTALVIPFSFKDWKQLLILISLFTIGHTLALFLSVFEIVVVRVALVEVLILFTILATAIFALFTAGKTTKTNGLNPILFVTLFFGIVHGFGFSNYFKTILGGTASSKIGPLMAFATGIEAAQIVAVSVVLLLSAIVQSVFRFSKRDWALTVSGFIIGVVLPMLLHNNIWN
jgi:HupE / UreJ protein